MSEKFIVFYDAEGNELAAYTKAETFPGERQATVELLSSERGIPETDILAKEEER